MLKRLSADERTRMLAEAREKAMFDEYGRLSEAEQRGIEKGIGQGIEIGEERAKHDFARKLLEEGWSIEKTAMMTELDISIVKSLFSSL